MVLGIGPHAISTKIADIKATADTERGRQRLHCARKLIEGWAKDVGLDVVHRGDPAQSAYVPPKLLARSCPPTQAGTSLPPPQSAGIVDPVLALRTPELSKTPVGALGRVGARESHPR